MDQRFPECKDLHALYRKCFAQQPFRWGQATGTTEDKCEDAYEAFRECVENSLEKAKDKNCLLYTSPSPRDRQKSRMPSSA